MTAFEPLTLGYDWELWLLEMTGEPALESKISDVAAKLRRARPECPTDLDYRSLEIRSGPCRHVDELRERTRHLLDLTAREARCRRLHFLASAGHPVYLNVLGAHVHVGSVYSLTTGMKIKTAMTRHAPALIALCAASPVVDSRVGEFKSYRVALRAHGCNVPISVGEMRTDELGWGEDACVKVWCHPTMELRLFDTPIHPGLYMEMAVLGAGLVAGLARRLRGAGAPGEVTVTDREDYLLNRLSAAEHGLQATFRRRDDAVSAVSAVEEALEIAADGMTELGLPPGDLVWIPKLLAGRVTQADFVLEMAERSPDPWALLTDLVRLSPDGVAFERWLESGPVREPRPVGSFRDYVRRGVNGYSRLRDVNRWANLPPFWFERVLETLERDGEVERVEDPDRGLRFRRVPSEVRTS